MKSDAENPPTAHTRSEEARLAALNLMEDAVQARQAVERLNAELRATQQALATQLEDAQRLQALSARLTQADDADALYEMVVDTAAGIMRTDMASLQVVDESENALRLLAWRGFGPEFGEIFSSVNGADAKTSCSLAMQRVERVIVPDVETADFLVGTEALESLRKTRIRAVQSTPLISRDGHVIGMVSTHWREPHEPNERELRMLDVLARQAADLLERSKGQESRARLAAIVQSSDDAIIGMDLDGIITTWNQGAERLFGYSALEAIGQPVAMVIPSDRAVEEPSILERVRHGQSVEQYETVRRRKDGGLVDVSLTVSPIKDAHGRVIGASKIARDITQHRRAAKAVQASEERYRSLMQIITSVVWTTDADGRFTTPQPSWSDYTGQTSEELSGFGWTNALHADDRERVRALWDAARASQSLYESDGRLWHAASGTYRRFEAHGIPILNDSGSVREWVGTCIDVEERKKAEEVLQQYAADMSETNRHKTEFLAMLAHELRNPLAPIRNAVKVVQMSEGNWPMIQSAGAIIERQVSHLVRLVEQLLDVSRVSVGKISLRKETVELASIVGDAVETIRAQVEKKEQELAVRLPEHTVHLHADPTRLVQVLGNLLNNASKFTAKGGAVWLDVACENEQCVIRVRDSGIGISPDKLPRIFEMFTQLDASVERTVGGLGIGLTLAKSLVELHGGVLEAHSPGLGQGSEFVVYLPVLANAPHHTPPEPSSAFAP